MSSKPKKRSRATVEDRRADCPFEVTIVPTPAARNDRDPKAAKRRKTEGGGGGGEEDKKPFFQISPFEPVGKFRSRETMDIHYHVGQRKRWTDMTKYMSFVLNGSKYFSDEFIFVANDDAIERQKSGKIPKHQVGPGDFWVARILEIRASDEHHVYARVFWMYSPDELPAATMSGKKTPAGRQPHHGMNELIASNHMDIINVVSVVQHARVNQWIESDEEEIQDALYWRQALECQTSQLSSIDLLGCCQMPANPDKTLVGCTNGDCGEWMHLECLRQDVLKRVYQRLGTDRPHIPEPPAIKKEEEDSIKRESPQAPLSPPKGDDDQLRATIAVHGDANTDAAVKQSDEGTPKLPEPTPPAAQLPLPEMPIRGLARKKSARSRGPTSKSWLDLFEADLRMSDGPMVWEVKDLRQGVTGGSKTWTEPALCLLCGHIIE
ncbi:Bromo adjacent region [Cordyceps javanica]|uniref:Bromo adjacent region n=1 Tax=Cordyceps javanica TaxID=43265 RepID=A0A545VZ04_9HYPO|nr:Bromo adjacent region [Cordyceps javanica]TQW06953.1 Bromo adjacent region [Cordyceps javanica]